MAATKKSAKTKKATKTNKVTKVSQPVEENSTNVYYVLATIVLFAVCCTLYFGKIIKLNNGKTTTPATEQIVTETYSMKDGSTLTINKGSNKTDVEISITRLALIRGEVKKESGDIYYITGKDASENPISFTFDKSTKVLTVSDSTWDFLPEGKTFLFN
ncbi:hypothetical protein J6Z48_02980 [bacterium]|nr:hypothetical protein [bacterium]